jgi:hypothetical protein
MEKTFFSSQGFAGIVLGGSLIVFGLIGGQAFLAGKHTDDTIAVTGAAERVVQSDVVKWSGSIGFSTPVDGYRDGSKRLSQQSKSLEAYLALHGVPTDAIAWSAPQFNPSCQNLNDSEIGDPSCNGGRLIGYSFNRSFTIESKDVDSVSKLSQDAPGDLFEQGIALQSFNPEFYVSDLPQLKLDMLDEATRNAHDRAERIVKATGANLGGLRSAGMGVFQVTAVNSTEISDYGAYDTATREKKITSIVRATFDLK